jgi:capsular exopolysaccharide synthesis family protein
VLPLTQIPNPAYEEALQEVQVLAGLVTEYRTQLANLDKMISEEQTTLRKAAEVESRRARLRVDLTVREQDYTSTYNELRRIRTLEMASRQLGSVTIMGPPVIYPGQSLSNSRIALLALFAGIGIGLAAIFGLDYVDNRVKTPYDMEQLFGLPIMGITPSFDNALHANGGSPLLHRVIPSWQDPSAENGLASAGEDYSYSPDSAHTEALRVVRTKILSSSPSLRSVMVTSTRSAQGKSTVAANLAILTAQISKNVILIDADLRRPTIHLHLGMANDTGLSEVLAGTACVDDVVRKTSVGNLRFLPAGIPPQNPADLISSDAMRELIEELSDQADLVIVDTPPVADFADSLVMARYVDGVMLAYRAGQMPLDVDIRAKAQLEGMQANLLGVVLTDVQRGVSGIGYSYDYYRYSYRPPQ